MESVLTDGTVENQAAFLALRKGKFSCILYGSETKPYWLWDEQIWSCRFLLTGLGMKNIAEKERHGNEERYIK